MLVPGPPDLQQLALVVFSIPATSANTHPALVVVMLYIYINYRLQVIKFADNRLKQHQEELDGLAACASACVRV